MNVIDKVIDKLKLEKTPTSQAAVGAGLGKLVHNQPDH